MSGHVKNTLISGLVVLVGLSSLSLPGETAESILKVCADPNNPPFSDKNGQGFENRIAELLAADSGKTLEYTWFPQRIGFIRNTLKFPLPKSQGKGYKCDVVIGVPTGYELTGTTRAYYRSTYAMVYRKDRLNDLQSATDIDKLPDGLRQTLRIAMFDGAPGTSWLMKHQLIRQGIPYQSMTGDAEINTARILERDFREDRIDLTIVWGPIAGYLQSRQPELLNLLPMQSEPGLQLDFAISMGVRIPDKQRKQELDEQIARNADKIRSILVQYRVPLVESTTPHDGQQ
jgi:mxaJ protein